MSTLPEAREGLQRVGYLGPEGTFSEEALLASVEAETVEPVAMASIYDTIKALREGFVRWAIVPIENSLEGSISVTLDCLARRARRSEDRGRGGAAGPPCADRRGDARRWRRSKR